MGGSGQSRYVGAWCVCGPVQLGVGAEAADGTVTTLTPKRRPMRSTFVTGNCPALGPGGTPTPLPFPCRHSTKAEGRAPGGHRPCVCTLPRPPPLPLPLPLWFPRSIHRTHTQLEDDTAEAPQSKVCSGQSRECGVGVHSTHLTSSLSLSHSRPQRLAV